MATDYNFIFNSNRNDSRNPSRSVRCEHKQKKNEKNESKKWKTFFLTLFVFCFFHHFLFFFSFQFKEGMKEIHLTMRWRRRSTWRVKPEWIKWKRRKNSFRFLSFFLRNFFCSFRKWKIILLCWRRSYLCSRKEKERTGNCR